MEGFRQGAFHFYFSQAVSLNRPINLCISGASLLPPSLIHTHEGFIPLMHRQILLSIALCARFAHTPPMSSPASGRTHLWFWVTAGVLLYVASCPPVEAWHERHYAQNSRSLPLGVAPTPAGNADAVGGGTVASTSAPSGTSSREGVFEIAELKYNELPKRPGWMQVLYAPVHFAEKYPPFSFIFQRYRLWCEDVF